jgi:hypothetical protein
MSARPATISAVHSGSGIIQNEMTFLSQNTARVSSAA